MAKVTISHVKNDHDEYDVHHIHGTPQKIHEAYGLWIIGFGRGGCSAPALDPGSRFRHFEFYNLSHMYDGHGYYVTPDGGLKEVAKGQAVVCAPGHVHHYGGYKDNYHEDAISFTGPVAKQLYDSGVLRSGVVEMGLSRRLLPVLDLAVDPAKDSQILANRELQNLLIDLYFENKRPHDNHQAQRLDKLLEKLRLNPGKAWTVAEMAEYCNVSENQFRRVFRKRSGMAPKKYLDRLKLSQAAERLRASAESVAEVAAAFAFDDQFHFSKRFKEVMGLSPSQYRAEASPLPPPAARLP